MVTKNHALGQRVSPAQRYLANPERSVFALSTRLTFVLFVDTRNNTQNQELTMKLSRLA